MGKDAGYIVELEDGRIGRTYHKDKPINGKIAVYLLAASAADMFGADGCKLLPQTERIKILCSPEKLKVTGMAD